MTLFDLIEDIETLDEELIIFQEDKDDLCSDFILSYGKDGDGGIKEVNGKKYYYLLEIFLAKEFMNDWISSLNNSPTSKEIAKRLYEYARNDA